MSARKLLSVLLVALAVSVAFWSLSRTLDGPWQRSWLGHNGARYAHIARNYLEHGLTHLGGAPLLDAGVHDPEAPDVYGHHPPALAMTLALVFRWAGPTERAARMLPVAATLVALILLALLVAGVSDPIQGGVAALVAATQPMVSVYGAHVDVQGPPVACLFLAVLLAYRRWLGGGSVVPLVVLSALASAFDWYGLYAPAGCALHLFFTRPSGRGRALALAAFTGALFAGWVAWLASRPGMSAERVFGAAGVRGPAGLGGGDSGLDVLAGGAGRWLTETNELMPGWPGLVLVCLAVLGGLSTVSRPRTDLGPRGLVALLLLPPLAHGLLFPAGMLVHAYWLFGLPWALAAGAALGLSRLRTGVVVACLVLLAGAGWMGAEAVLDPERADAIPAAMGGELAAQTAPGDLILTNYDVNPLDQAAPAGYVLMRPEVTYYARRAIRGGIITPADLDRALAALPAASHFLLTPPAGSWGTRPAPAALEAALRSRSAAAPTSLSGEPPVWLFHLKSP